MGANIISQFYWDINALLLPIHWGGSWGYGSCNQIFHILDSSFFFLRIFFNYKCLVENINFNIKTYEIEINLLIESQIGFFLINFYSQQKKYSTIF